MSKQRFLKHRKTGVVFPFNEALAAQNRHMVPCDKDGKSKFDEVDVVVNVQSSAPPDPANPDLPPEPETDTDDADDTDDDAGTDDMAAQLAVGDTTLDKATKAQMEAFAKMAFGVDLDKRKTADDLRAEVLALHNGQGA